MTRTWRDRLKAALKDRNISKRAASLAAEMGPGYVHSILSEGKEPTIDNLVRLCEANSISPTFVIFGYSVTPEIEELTRLYQSAPDQTKLGIRQILGAHKAP